MALMPPPSRAAVAVAPYAALVLALCSACSGPHFAVHHPPSLSGSLAPVNTRALKRRSQRAQPHHAGGGGDGGGGGGAGDRPARRGESAHDGKETRRRRSNASRPQGWTGRGHTLWTNGIASCIRTRFARTV
eukprot:6190926-Pleurochrysis_carterae.AAC.2